jgi:DNA/RNA-binding domain of Phe-tRNA-synthetase-like protein
MTRQITFSINKQLLEKFPAYRRAILVVTDVDNKQVSTLDSDIMEIAQNIKRDVVLENPRISAWREAFAAVGIKARDFRPSIDALVRRIHNDKPLGSISPIVDVGTVVSLHFVLPAGAHPILSDTTNVDLTIATGEEVEISDGTHPNEQIPAGEPILLDNERVATRRWVWRQTSLSRIDENTRDFYLNIDALATIDDRSLNEAIDYSKEVISRVFNRDCKLCILSADNLTETIEIN